MPINTAPYRTALPLAYRITGALTLTLTLSLAFGAASAQNNVEAEANDVAEALGRLNQSYKFPGLRSGHGSAIVGGSQFGDAPDRTAGDGTQPPAARVYAPLRDPNAIISLPVKPLPPPDS